MLIIVFISPKTDGLKKLESEPTVPLDDLKKYLSEPPISPDIITEAGGYIKYWHQAKETHPHLSKMGSDFCSVPGQWHTKLFYYLRNSSLIFSFFG
jgi:hypothetical protein